MGHQDGRIDPRKDPRPEDCEQVAGGPSGNAAGAAPSEQQDAKKKATEASDPDVVAAPRSRAPKSRP